jgi:NAD(P)-dependent dehydrogenase (short-subunit alcohol dehydrogenase family)
MGSMMGMRRPFVLGPGTLSPPAHAAHDGGEGDDVDLGLTDKVALVTGSYRGTGSGIARALAAEGAVVLVHGHETGRADEVAAEIAGGGGRAHVVVGDLRTEDGTAALVDDVRAQVGRVDVVVNNFGNTDHASDWEAADSASWHGSYDVNVVSAFRVTQAFLPDMRDAGWGRVVVMSTVGATRPGDTIPEYYTAKGALPSMAVGLAKHLAGTGITVNCVSPGIIATAEVVASYTERARRAGRDTDWHSVQAFVQEGRMANPTGRVPTPDEVGRFVAFVVSEPAWHLNGAHLRLDGGASDAVT